MAVLQDLAVSISQLQVREPILLDVQLGLPFRAVCCCKRFLIPATEEQISLYYAQ
jgi:hypothetical protein